MTDILNRIIGLSDMIGVDLTPNGEELAELKAYAAGLELILQELVLVEESVSPDTATGKALMLFCNQFDIDGNIPEARKRQLICERFRDTFAQYEQNGLENAFGRYGVSSSVVERSIVIYDSVVNNGLLEELGRILRNYQSPFTSVIIDGGEGLDFDFWDSTQLSFNGYDRLALPFYITEQLK